MYTPHADDASASTWCGPRPPARSRPSWSTGATWATSRPPAREADVRCPLTEPRRRQARRAHRHRRRLAGGPAGRGDAARGGLHRVADPDRRRAARAVRPAAAVQAGAARAGCRPTHTALPRRRAIDAQWRLGVAATGLDLVGKRVRLADGEEVGVRPAADRDRRPRPAVAERGRGRPGRGLRPAHPRGRGRLNRRLTAGPRRVLVIGAGFTGSEIASACRERGLAVTVAERGPAPLVGALGGVVGAVAAELQREHGVDLRCGVTVTALEGDSAGRLARAHLSDGTDARRRRGGGRARRDAQHRVAGRIRARPPGPRGIACDAGCRAFDVHGIVTDDIFVAGDVARSPHPLFGYQFLSLEHWGNAVAQAEIAAHNMISAGPDRRPHLWVPAFWSAQFGVNIKSVGVPTMGDEIVIAQGSLAERRFAAVYGYQGRVIAAVTFDQARWLDFYQRADRVGRAVPARLRHRGPAPRRTAAGPGRLPGPLPAHPRADRHPQRLLARRPAGHLHPGPCLTRAPTPSTGPPKAVPTIRTRHDAATLLRQITDYANRADPYPLYAELRKTPVAGRRTAPTSSAPTGRSRPCCTTRGSAPTAQPHSPGRGAPSPTGGGRGDLPPSLPQARPARARPAAPPGDAAVRPAAHPPADPRHARRTRPDRLRTSSTASRAGTRSTSSTTSPTPSP